jgi:SnoaL-like protein
MFERIRFVRYALAFEKAFKSDDWSAVKTHFHGDATYTITGSGSRYDGVYRGPDEICATFKRMLDEVDRKFDSRAPRLRGFPRVRGGELELPWKVRYRTGADAMWLTGTSRCRFSDGKIRELTDAMDADEVARWAAMVGVR